MEEVRLEDKLQKSPAFSSRQLNSIFEVICSTALNPLIIVDGEGIIRSANESAHTLCGYGSEEMSGESYRKLVPRKERALHMQALEVLTADGREIKANITISDREGQPILTSSRIRRLDLESEIYFIWSLEDLRKKKKLREELRLRDQRHSALVDNLSIYLWTLDENLCFVNANRSAKAIFKKSFDYDFEPGDYVMNLYMKRNHIDEKIWLDNYHAVLNTGESRSFEIAEVFYGRFSHINVELHPILRNERVMGISVQVENDTNEYLKNRLNEALSNFKSKVLNVNSISDLLWAVTDEVLSKLHLEDAIILMKKGDFIQIKTAYGSKRVGSRRIDTPLKIQIGQGVSGSVALSGEPEIVNDVHRDERYYEVHFEAGSEIVVPIKVNGEVIGVINCESRHKNFFKPIHLEILNEVAGVTAEKISRIIADRHIRKVEELNRAVLNSTPNSYLLLSPRMQVESFNRTAFKGFGALQGELRKGTEILNYVPPAHVEEFKRAFHHALSGNRISAEKEFQHPEYGNMWIKVTLSPAINSAKIIFGVTLIIEEITAQKNNEQLILKQNEELRKANQELDKFVYSVSHDLRSPVSSVMGISSLIKMSDSIEEVQEYNELIADSMDRMDNFIRNILDYSRNSRVDIQMEEILPREMIDDILADHSYVDGFRNIEIKLNIAIKKMYSDRQRMGIILRNLMSNAVKYHDSSKPDRFIEVNMREEDGFYLLDIADNGQGIEDKHLQNLFNMFFTAHKTSGGSGIGLYIVKEAVHALGGDIQVRSTVAEGTVFSVKLPIGKASAL